jgi:hypothetical protein
MEFKITDRTLVPGMAQLVIEKRQLQAFYLKLQFEFRINVRGAKLFISQRHKESKLELTG